MMNLPIVNRKEYHHYPYEHMFAFYEESETKAVMVGDPEGEPHHLFLRDGGAIVMHLLIFAQSRQDAYDRVKTGLEMLMKINNNPIGASRLKTRYDRLIEAGLSCVTKFDKRFVGTVPWATNDTIA